MDSSLLSTITPEAKLLSCINTRGYKRFLAKACNKPNIRYAALTLPFECNDPLRWFDQNKNAFPFHYYLENPSQNHVLAAIGQTQKLTAHGPKRFAEISQSVHAQKKQILHYSKDQAFDQLRYLGGYSFFDQPHTTAWNRYPSASFTLPAFTLCRLGSTSSLSITVEVNRGMEENELHRKIEHKINGLTSVPEFKKLTFVRPHKASLKDRVQESEYKNWQEIIEKARHRMSTKDLNKVVLARQLRIEASGNLSPIKSLQYLRTNYPQCQSFLIKMKGAATFVGSTPELLMEVKGDQLKTEALAGSIARGENKREDEQLAQNLLASFKNNEEHQYVVDHVAELCRPFTKEFNYPDRPKIKALSNVQHLYTPITATLKDDARPLELLGKLHPTPAVGGTPRNKALTFIKEHEDFDRGWFAGPVGWITPDQDCHFSVAIRSGLIGKDQARLFAGCGIVAGSDPKKEWKETKLKFKPMLSALHYG